MLRPCVLPSAQRNEDIDMNYYRFPEKPVWKMGFAIFLLLQLMLTRSGMSGTRLGFLESQFLMLGVIVLVGIVFLLVNHRELKAVLCDSRMAAAGVFVLVMLLPMLIKQDWQMMYFTILLGLLLAVFLSYFVTLKETAKCYVLLLCGLCVYSVAATYFLRLLPDKGIVDVPRFLNAVGNEYYDFGLAFVSITHVASRNLGIFREPGVYQFFLLLALYLTNYCVDWKKNSNMWLANGILAVTMLTTMATGGVIELGLFAVVLFFDKKMYQNKRLRMLAIGMAAGVILVVIVSFLQKNAIYWFLYNTLLEKFINRTDSVTDRTAAIAANLQLFAQHPVFGARLSEVLHAVSNNTSSTLILYAGYGILGGSLNVACWAALVWKQERRLWANLALLVIMFMAFNTQNLTWDLYFWLFPVMALLERGVPYIQRLRMRRTSQN